MPIKGLMEAGYRFVGLKMNMDEKFGIGLTLVVIFSSASLRGRADANSNVKMSVSSGIVSVSASSCSLESLSQPSVSKTTHQSVNISQQLTRAAVLNRKINV